LLRYDLRVSDELVESFLKWQLEKVKKTLKKFEKQLTLRDADGILIRLPSREDERRTLKTP